jgi:hypothetical protein
MALSSGFIERAAALASLVGHIVFAVEAYPTREVVRSKSEYAQRLPTDQPNSK